MKELVLGEPAPFIDQHPLHQCDLPGWPSEGQHANRGPNLHGFEEGRVSGVNSAYRLGVHAHDLAL